MASGFMKQTSIICDRHNEKACIRRYTVSVYWLYLPGMDSSL